MTIELVGNFSADFYDDLLLMSADNRTDSFDLILCVWSGWRDIRRITPATKIAIAKDSIEEICKSKE